MGLFWATISSQEALPFPVSSSDLSSLHQETKATQCACSLVMMQPERLVILNRPPYALAKALWIQAPASLMLSGFP